MRLCLILAVLAVILLVVQASEDWDGTADDGIDLFKRSPRRRRRRNRRRRRGGSGSRGGGHVSRRRFTAGNAIGTGADVIGAGADIIGAAADIHDLAGGGEEAEY